jgi:hypothetical protein
MKKLFTLILLLTSTTLFAQSSEDVWAKWDKKYPEVNVADLFKQEKLYADSVERHPDIPRYYFRRAAYRFNAQYLGKIKPLDKAVALSMKNVNKLTAQNQKEFEKLLGPELLVKVGGQEIWVSIQPQMLEAFKQEVKVNSMVTLYCLYLNEHNSQNKLYNTFLISEFISL